MIVKSRRLIWRLLFFGLAILIAVLGGEICTTQSEIVTDEMFSPSLLLITLPFLSEHLSSEIITPVSIRGKLATAWGKMRQQ